MNSVTKDEQMYAKQRAKRQEPAPLTHLYRGSPCVRSWSKYQETVKAWALCGIYDERNAGRKIKPKARSWAEADLLATEDASQVTCTQCVRLMHPEACSAAKAPCGFCEASKVHRVRERRLVREALAQTPAFGETRIGTPRERFLTEESSWREDELLYGPGKREVKP